MLVHLGICFVWRAVCDFCFGLQNCFLWIGQNFDAFAVINLNKYVA